MLLCKRGGIVTNAWFIYAKKKKIKGSIATRNLSTELQLSVSDFDKYEIKTESEITISLRNIKVCKV